MINKNQLNYLDTLIKSRTNEECFWLDGIQYYSMNEIEGMLINNYTLNEFEMNVIIELIKLK